MTPDCRKYRKLFSEYLDERLPADEREALEEHLSGCPECREEMRAWRATVRAVGELPARTPRAGFARRVAERIEATETGPKKSTIPGRWRQVLPLAALFLVIVGLSVFLFHEAGRDAAPGERLAMQPEQTEEVASEPAPAQRTAKGRAEPAAPSEMKGAATEEGPARAEEARRRERPAAAPEAQKTSAGAGARSEAVPPPAEASYPAADRETGPNVRLQKMQRLTEVARKAMPMLGGRGRDETGRRLTVRSGRPAEDAGRVMELAIRQGMGGNLQFAPDGRIVVLLNAAPEQVEKLLASVSESFQVPQRDTLGARPEAEQPEPALERARPGPVRLQIAIVPVEQGESPEREDADEDGR